MTVSRAALGRRRRSPSTTRGRLNPSHDTSLLLAGVILAFAAVDHSTSAAATGTPAPALSSRRVSWTIKCDGAPAHASLSSLSLDPLFVRGGATVVADEDEDEDDDENGDREAIEVIPSKLTSSTVKAVEKSRAKKSAEIKTAVSASLSQKLATKTKKKKSLGLKLPYILRAFFNPFTLIAMTRAYFASLFQVDYLQKQQDATQNLRSALEEKAKRGDNRKPPSKPKRGMKPGQAKTLSDLPRLSA